MREIFGKHVYDSLEEIVNPKHTAILVVDMQNDFCSIGGFFEGVGLNIATGQEMLPNLVRLIDEGRKRGAEIISTQSTTLKDGLSDSASWLSGKVRVARVKAEASPQVYSEEGTWGEEFIEDMAPRTGEPVVKKHRSGGFVSTALDLILRANGIETVIITGTVSHSCVEDTARGALDHGYYVVLASDCVCSAFKAEMHEAALKYLPLICEVVPSDEILKTWAES